MEKKTTHKKVNDFFAEQDKTSQLFGLYPSKKGQVRIFLWMEGYEDFHKVFVDIPETAIDSVIPTDKKVLHHGKLLILSEIVFSDGVESLFTIHDLFKQLSNNCILLPGQSDDDTKTRRGALVDDVVPRARGAEKKELDGISSFSRPVV